METYINYKGYGITYQSFRGLTKVDSFGIVLKRFNGCELFGNTEAKKYIDKLTSN